MKALINVGEHLLALAPTFVYRRRWPESDALNERLKRLLPDGESSPQLSIDPQRLAQEIALLADRSDVTEEVTRLATHLDEVQRLLSDPRPAGRRLDFLAQELNREANTIASKSVGLKIADCAIELKLLIEQVREQVQNIE